MPIILLHACGSLGDYLSFILGLRYTHVMRSSRISWKSGALSVRYSQKEHWMSFVFHCSENPSSAYNFGTTGPIQAGFSAKCTSPNKHLNQIFRKLKMSPVQFWIDFPRLITNNFKGIPQLHISMCFKTCGLDNFGIQNICNPLITYSNTSKTGKINIIRVRLACLWYHLGRECWKHHQSIPSDANMHAHSLVSSYIPEA